MMRKRFLYTDFSDNEHLLTEKTHKRKRSCKITNVRKLMFAKLGVILRGTVVNRANYCW